MDTKYYLICDCGDGTSCIHWFDEEEDARFALENDECYFANECIGSISGINLVVN